MKPKTNLALDIAIFIVFLAVASPSLTGMTIHEWLALAFAAALIVHLLFHWKWMVAVIGKFYKKLFHQSRLNLIVDVAFFITMAATMLSGILISKSVLGTLGISLQVGHNWQTIHKLMANFSLILLGLHFGLHIKWIVSSLKRYLVSPVLRRVRRVRT